MNIIERFHSISSTPLFPRSQSDHNNIIERFHSILSTPLFPRSQSDRNIIEVTQVLFYIEHTSILKTNPKVSAITVSSNLCIEDTSIY